ncbi:hypothetical protein D6850_08490 [Roseovarius spongiae]|uniref:Uncharacterized protein n=2 Tax=Roseovarius spongiae TaxID=2320272 RepID=A0A3A8AUZ6_9RHOB|nr:hypothetical protein D6850_08490 [Roseovarius spongiae]
MHWTLVKEAIARCENAKVVAHDVAPENMETALRNHAPDVLILGAQVAPAQRALLEDWLQGGWSRRKVITLFDDPSLGELREWRLVVESLTDISLNSLCTAIQGRG